MNRPAPRKSAFSGTSPVAPPPTSEPEAAQVPSSSDKAQPAKKVAAKKDAAEGKKHPPKVSFYSDPDDTARMRGAFRATLAQEGWSSLSQFLSAAVMAEVERLEAKYNGGKPFVPVDAGGIPQGRPVGE